MSIVDRSLSPVREVLTDCTPEIWAVCCSIKVGGLNRSMQHFIFEGKMECGMERRFHRGFTAAEKTELWDRWKRGELLKAIGRAFGKKSSSIYFLVAPHGGIRSAERRRSRLALTLAEREVISRGVTAHQSARSIAKLLGRAPSPGNEPQWRL